MKKPIAAIITDTHADENTLDLVDDIYDQSIEIVESLGLKELFHIGDHFTNRASQKLKTLLRVRRFTQKFKKVGIIVRTIPGNHDKTDQSSTESYLDIYRSNNFVVYSGKNPEAEFTEIDDVRFYFLPYFSESVYQEKLESIIKSLDNSKSNVLLTHIGIDGVLDNDDRKVLSSVKKSNFKAFKKVFIGHYHNASDVNDFIHYIGSTDPRNFGEDDKKGILIVFDDLSFERIQLNFKPYKKVIIEKFELEDLDDLIKKHADRKENVRIEFRAERSELIKIDKKKFLEAGIDVVTVDTTLIDISGETSEGDVTIGMERKDILKYFDEYCKQNQIERKKSAKIIKLF